MPPRSKGEPFRRRAAFPDTDFRLCEAAHVGRRTAPKHRRVPLRALAGPNRQDTGPVRQWDSNAVLWDHAKFFPAIQGFARLTPSCPCRLLRPWRRGNSMRGTRTGNTCNGNCNGIAGPCRSRRHIPVMSHPSFRAGAARRIRFALVPDGASPPRVDRVGRLSEGPQSIRAAATRAFTPVIRRHGRVGSHLDDRRPAKRDGGLL